MVCLDFFVYPDVVSRFILVVCLDILLYSDDVDIWLKKTSHSWLDKTTKKKLDGVAFLIFRPSTAEAPPIG